MRGRDASERARFGKMSGKMGDRQRRRGRGEAKRKRRQSGRENIFRELRAAHSWKLYFISILCQYASYNVYLPASCNEYWNFRGNTSTASAAISRATGTCFAFLVYYGNIIFPGAPYDISYDFSAHVAPGLYATAGDDCYRKNTLSYGQQCRGRFFAEKQEIRGRNKRGGGGAIVASSAIIIADVSGALPSTTGYDYRRTQTKCVARYTAQSTRYEKCI